MTRYEKTGERPTNYSRWHREQLPDFCTAQDIDWIEYRKSETGEIIPVAIIETGRWNRSKFKGNQLEITKKIGMALNIPSYFVEYSIDEKNYKKSKFKVKFLNDSNKEIVLDNNEYKEFIKGLKRKKVNDWM